MPKEKKQKQWVIMFFFPSISNYDSSLFFTLVVDNTLRNEICSTDAIRNHRCSGMLKEDHFFFFLQKARELTDLFKEKTGDLKSS